MPEIMQFPKNERGNDYIIGDVHGSSALKIVIDELGPHDRLFIVGDLFDRGGHEVEVFNLIRGDSRIHAVRGNHENMLLDAMAGKDVENFLRNGGGWICSDSEVQGFFRDYVSRVEDYSLIPEEYRNTLTNHFTKEPKIKAAADIQQFVTHLPYIIKVGEGPDAFIVCHADLPIDDNTLNTLLRAHKSTPLPPDVKSHIVWARPWEFANARSRNSIIVYCGHNIVGMENEVVRAETNHINLDAGAYLRNHFLMLNHTRKEVNVIGKIRQGQESDYEARWLLEAMGNTIAVFLRDRNAHAAQSDTQEKFRSSFERFDTVMQAFYDKYLQEQSSMQDDVYEILSACAQVDPENADMMEEFIEGLTELINELRTWHPKGKSAQQIKNSGLKDAQEQVIEAIENVSRCATELLETQQSEGHIKKYGK